MTIMTIIQTKRYNGKNGIFLILYRTSNNIMALHITPSLEHNLSCSTGHVKDPLKSPE
jgi:hypothetical protein